MTPEARRRRAALSLVEILIAMTILAGLLSVVLNRFQDTTRTSREIVCKDQLAALRDRVETWQLRSRRPWFRPVAPPDFPLDPWGQPFRIDPHEGWIWSMGPGGKTTEPPRGQEGLASRYEPYPTQVAAVPRGVRALLNSFGEVRLTWSWPRPELDVVGFEILRADPTVTTETPPPGMPPVTRRGLGEFVPVATVPPEEPLEYLDEDVELGEQYGYRVRALPGPGQAGKEPTASPPVVYTVPVDVPPPPPPPPPPAEEEVVPPTLPPPWIPAQDIPRNFADPAEVPPTPTASPPGTPPPGP